MACPAAKPTASIVVKSIVALRFINFSFPPALHRVRAITLEPSLCVRHARLIFDRFSVGALRNTGSEVPVDFRTLWLAVFRNQPHFFATRTAEELQHRQ